MNEKMIKCNLCGNRIKKENEIYIEDFVTIKKTWGYFSQKDGYTHSFVLCEKCYDELVKKFTIPIYEEETAELM